jgi:hypothetical protein
MTKYMAFDLEVARLVDPDQNPGITCAAVAASDGRSMTWAGRCAAWWAAEMSDLEVGQLVRTLLYWSREYTFVTWNGVGYDWRVLAERVKISPAFAPTLYAEIAALAMHHIDPAFLCLCQMGYMLGLEAVAQALGVQGKMAGMRGDLEPLLWGGLGVAPLHPESATDEERATWAERLEAVKAVAVEPGSQEARRLILRYVAQDARATLDVYQGLCKIGGEGLRWTTKKGTRSTKAWDPARVEGALLTVADARMLAEPDTSWMTEPRTRESCMDWTRAGKKEG